MGEATTELRPHFSDEEWTSAAASTINAHYTSVDVIRWMWQVVERLGISGGKVLEPASVWSLLGSDARSDPAQKQALGL